MSTVTSTATSFDTFIERAWSDHADRPQEVADRLAASHHLLTTPAHIPPFARLLTHVYGEHLGQWQRGIEQLAALRSLAVFDSNPDAAAALTRSIATLRYGDGDASAIAALSIDDRVTVLATVASAFAGRDLTAAALAAYADALRLADAGLPRASPAVRALAVGGNNLAATLEQKSNRSAAETAGMIAAATAALTYWRQAGTWLEEERAHYRLARSLLQASDPAAAAQHATQCVDICERNRAPASDMLYGCSVLAVALHANGDDAFASVRERGLAVLAHMPVDERHASAPVAAELHALRPLADAPSAGR